MSTPTNEPCPFCDIINGDAPALVVFSWEDALAIVPLEPVVPGHLIVIPKKHVRDHGEDPEVTALTARRFAEMCAELGDCDNMISNRGTAATQSVFHLHLHYVPRQHNDGVALPWYSGKARSHPQI